jgi:hypothetical protein
MRFFNRLRVIQEECIYVHYIHNIVEKHFGIGNARVQRRDRSLVNTKERKKFLGKVHFSTKVDFLILVSFFVAQNHHLLEREKVREGDWTRLNQQDCYHTGAKLKLI